MASLPLGWTRAQVYAVVVRAGWWKATRCVKDGVVLK
jgi:hypothetical protein